MNNLKKIIKYLYEDILYFISKIFPKDKNLWLFGAWFGNSFNDNSKYMYLYVLKNHPEIKAYWITKNDKVYKALKKSGLPVVKQNSLKGLILGLRAKVYIMSTSVGDIRGSLYTKKNLGVQLWHGIGIKKIGYSTTFGSIPPFWEIKKKIFPFMASLYNYDIVISTSKLWQERFSEAFRLPEENIPITGQPRCDIFYQKKPQKKDYIQILFTPTHRKQGHGEIKSILPSEEELYKINEFLKTKNAILKMKLHFYDMKFLPKNINFSNIQVVDFDPLYDIQEELLNTDILLVDYSGTYDDFLLLDRPVVFTAFDIEDYQKEDQGFYEPFEDVAAGRIAKNWDEVLDGIEEAINEPDKYKKKRKEVRDRYWDLSIQNGNSAKRVFEVIIKHPKMNK